MIPDNNLASRVIGSPFKLRFQGKTLIVELVTLIFSDKAASEQLAAIG
jgi:hypothetical protein